MAMLMVMDWMDMGGKAQDHGVLERLGAARLPQDGTGLKRGGNKLLYFLSCTILHLVFFIY